MWWSLPWTPGKISVQPSLMISTDMEIEYISNFDFARQTFDMIVNLEQEVRSGSKTVEVTPNLFRDVQFDAIENMPIGSPEYTFKGMNITGVRTRERLTVPCHFSHYFPFDRHICALKLISRRLPLDQLTLTWQTPPRLSTATMNTPYLLVDQMSPITCDHKGSIPSGTSSSATFASHSCLAIHLEFVRSLCLVFYRFYIPSSAALFLAWTSFYISRTDLTSRILIVSISIILQVFICAFFLHSIPIPVALTTPADVWCALLIVQSTVVIAFIFTSIVLEAQVGKYRELSVDSKVIREDSRARHERRAMRSAMYRKENNHTEKSACSYATVVGSIFRRKGDATSLCSARTDLVARLTCPAIYTISTSLYFLLYTISPYG